jgi:hypothetical protein
LIYIDSRQLSAIILFIHFINLWNTNL